MAPEEADREAPENPVTAVSGAPVRSERPGHSALTIDFLNVDGRLVTLERDSVEYRRHLLVFEDALIGQIYTVAILELVLATFLAVTAWSQYRARVERDG